MHPTLARLEQELIPALEGLNATQTQLSPTSHPEKWSIQHIVDHLLLTYALTGRSLEDRIAKGRPTQAPILLKHRARQFVVMTLGAFPGRRTAPALVDPSPAKPATGRALIRAVHHELTSLDQRANQAESLFKDLPTASHHVLGPLSIPQWRKFHLVHTRRHIKQILAIRRDHAV
jgi:DinB superfamily